MPKLKETVKELIKKSKKEVEETVETSPLAPAFDPEIPEQKQRWLR